MDVLQEKMFKKLIKLQLNVHVHSFTKIIFRRLEPFVAKHIDSITISCNGCKRFCMICSVHCIIIKIYTGDVPMIDCDRKSIS